MDIWLRHFSEGLKPIFLLFRSGEGTLQGMGAFQVVKDETGESGMSLLGSEDVWDYRDWVIASGWEKTTFEKFLEFFRDGPWKFVDLPGISEFSPTLRLFPAVGESSGYKVTSQAEETAIFIPLPASWEEFLGGLKGKDRHELRRKMRRLETEASFRLKFVGEEMDLEEGFQLFLNLHRRSRQEKAAFMDSNRERYFRDLAATFQKKGWLRLSLLEINQEPAATFFSFRDGQTEYVFNSGYDPAIHRFSPGIILAALCIREAIRDGLKIFHFLRGTEDYKYRLGGREEKIYRIRLEKKPW
jgi:hypothetical protein